MSGGSHRDEGGDERVLYEWARNDHEVIRATAKTWKGKPYYSLRLYYRSEDDGEYHPTKKGLTLGADHVGDLVKAVKAISETAKSDGSEG